MPQTHGPLIKNQTFNPFPASDKPLDLHRNSPTYLHLLTLPNLHICIFAPSSPHFDSVDVNLFRKIPSTSNNKVIAKTCYSTLIMTCCYFFPQLLTQHHRFSTEIFRD